MPPSGLKSSFTIAFSGRGGDCEQWVLQMDYVYATWIRIMLVLQYVVHYRLRLWFSSIMEQFRIIE